MAMKIWVYAGGGQTEYLGLKNCLTSSFKGLDSQLNFNLKTPHLKKNAGKPRPREDGSISTPLTTSSTGKSLLAQIEQELPRAIEDEQRRAPKSTVQSKVCDVILVLDDLDCRQYDPSLGLLSTEEKIHDLISEYEKRVKEILARTILTTEESWPKVIVGFASPEIESWIIAGWSECRPLGFTNNEWSQMQRWLRDDMNNGGYQLDFNNPEIFGGGYNGQSCRIKLSEQIVAASRSSSSKTYTKAKHSSEALQKLNIAKDTVTRKCPILRKMVQELQRL
jgi:hypothetical protein